LDSAKNTFDLGGKIVFGDDAPTAKVESILNLSESFEGFAPGLPDADWTIVGGGGANLVGNQNIKWTLGNAGIEIQSGGVGGSAPSDGLVHAEFDTDSERGGPSQGTTMTTLTTQVDLVSPELSMRFDYKPRPADPTDSGMKVKVADVEVTITGVIDGQLQYTADPVVQGQPGVTVTPVTNPSTGWTTVTLVFTDLPTKQTTVSFSGVDKTADGGEGTGDELGAYLDNIHLSAEGPASLTAILEEESAVKDGAVIGNNELDGLASTALVGPGAFTGKVNWGADGFDKVTAVTFGDQTVKVDGDGKVYFNDKGVAQTGESGSAAVLEVKSTGEYTLTVTGAMNHSADGKVFQGEDLMNLNTVTIIGQDKDGDSIGVNLTAQVMDDVAKDVGGQQTLVMATENGLIGTASLGVDVGSDVVGATVKIDAANTVTADDPSQNWVYGSFKVGDIDKTSILKVDGKDLYYHHNGNNELVAQYDKGVGESVQVFKVSGSVDQNTGMTSYTVQQDIGASNQITTATKESVDLGQINLVGLSAIVKDGDGDTLTKGITVILDQQASTSGESKIVEVKTHTIEGTTGNDVIVGSSGADLILGGKGNDILVGGGGKDILEGGEGDDTLKGGDGNDTLIGGAGKDTLEGGEGDDTLVGTTMGSTLDGGAGTDTASYAAETQGVIAILDDAVSPSSDATGSATHDTSGTAPADKLVNIENVTGGSGDDTITGNSSANVLVGGAGDDMLKGGEGNDTLIGGADDDTLIGGAGDDTLIGGSGSDTLTGGVGSDVIQINLADVGTEVTPANDLITDLGKSDQLLLADLLPDAANDSNLSSYLPVTASGPDAVVTVDANAGAAGGVSEVVTVADTSTSPAELTAALTFTGPTDLVTITTTKADPII